MSGMRLRSGLAPETELQLWRPRGLLWSTSGYSTWRPPVMPCDSDKIKKKKNKVTLCLWSVNKLDGFHNNIFFPVTSEVYVCVFLLILCGHLFTFLLGEPKTCLGLFLRVACFLASVATGTHCNENPISTVIFLFGNYMIYRFPGSVHIFGCSKIDSPILEIYKSLTDIWV